MKHHRRLAAIVLLGAALRLCSVWYGLPHLRVRPDEETALLHAAAILGPTVSIYRRADAP